MATKDTTPKPIKVWTKRLADYKSGADVLSKSMINALRHIVNDRWTRTPEKSQVAEWVLKNFGYGSVSLNLTQDQCLQGLAWIQRRDVLKLMNPRCRGIVENFKAFTFQGLWEGRAVYRVHAKDGDWFDYTAAPWQSGSEAPFVIVSSK